MLIELSLRAAKAPGTDEVFCGCSLIHIYQLVKDTAILISPLKKRLGLKKENFVGRSHRLSVRGGV